MSASSPERRRHVSAIRRLLRLRPQPDQNPLLGSSTAAKKPSMLLRGLGCTSSAAAEVGTAQNEVVREVREGEYGDGKRSRRRRKKKKKEKGGGGGGGGGGGATAADVWCVEASSVDCVVERAHRERHCISRRVSMQEQMAAYMESPPNFFGPDMVPPGRLLRRARAYHHSPPVLQDEMMMYSTRMLFGGMSFIDRHRDWRLDVDNMSYEELLELEDKIGYVSTGLSKEEISRKIEPFFNPSIHFSSSETERKCTICQEEYEENEEMGKLECGHIYHLYCIKQWLSHKNSCPVCKSSVSKTGN
ncbi:hypothetical protein LUZ60_008102 [Juncus effusus]|nr:hypothetical protein LUZ60_008102 [Juncus effusus]